MFHSVADGHMAVRNAFFSPGRNSPQGSPRHRQVRSQRHTHEVQEEKEKVTEKDDELLEDVFAVETRPSLPKAKGVLKHTTSVDCLSAHFSQLSIDAHRYYGGEVIPERVHEISPGRCSDSQGFPPPNFDARWDGRAKCNEYDDEADLDAMEDAKRSLAVARKVLKLSWADFQSNGKVPCEYYSPS